MFRLISGLSLWVSSWRPADVVSRNCLDETKSALPIRKTEFSQICSTPLFLPAATLSYVAPQSSSGGCDSVLEILQDVHPALFSDVRQFLIFDFLQQGRYTAIMTQAESMRSMSFEVRSVQFLKVGFRRKAPETSRPESTCLKNLASRSEMSAIAG